MVAVQWTDKRQMNVLFTNSDPEMKTVQRRAKGGLINVEIPAPVLTYNSAIFSIDLNDQHHDTTMLDVQVLNGGDIF